MESDGRTFKNQRANKGASGTRISQTLQMMSEERKWKRGDIGPDGRVFAGYVKKCKNGEYWTTPDGYQELKAKRNAREKSHDSAERIKAYRRSDKHKEIERARNRSRVKSTEYKAAQRKFNLKRSFRKRDGSSLSSFLKSTIHPAMTLSLIMDIAVPDGKTLVDVIHEFSGYEMSVCEEIANLCKGEFPDA